MTDRLQPTSEFTADVLTSASDTAMGGEGGSGRVWRKSPFFGRRPAALALLQIDVHGVDCPGAGLRFMRALKQLAWYPSLRWQVGVGPPLIAGWGTRHGPVELRPLQLNGDSAVGLRAGRDESDLVLAIGGTWQDVLAMVEQARATLLRKGFDTRAVQLGHDEGHQRTHSGFIDGTSNLQELSASQFARCVFVQPSDDPDYAGGTYLIFRKYEEDVEMWNDLPDSVQEQMVGRTKRDGSFLDARIDWKPSTWTHTPPFAHVRCVNSRDRGTASADFWRDRIYRRSIKFAERRPSGGLRYGLHFLALVRSPSAQVERIHNTRMIPDAGLRDALMTSGYVRPLASAVYYLAPMRRMSALIDYSGRRR